MIGNTSCTDLPPGFRFHPTDEELIMYYLRNQAMSRPCPVSIIPEVDFYKFDPWQLPEKAGFGENEWYFFTPRDRKYPNGVRPNRATASGYWKATGTDKAIYSGSKYVGVKKALVFYKGRPPKGVKTDWIMHEYRLNESKKQTQRQSGSMRLDDWVLCRIYKKKHTGRHVEDQTVENLCTQMDKPNTVTDSVNVSVEPQKLKFPRTCSLSHLLELDYLGPISHILNDNTYQNFDFSSITSNGEIENPGKVELGEMTHQYTDSGKFQVNQAHFFNNQPLFVNPVVYDFQ